MNAAQSFIDELTAEAATTRRVLQRVVDAVPDDKLTWKPHEKSMSLGQLALHVAETPGLLAGILKPSVEPLRQFTQDAATSTTQLLPTLDKSIADAAEALLGWGNDGLSEEWRLVDGDKTIMAVPRGAMVRSVMLNHWYHHRGQLTVYLRMLDVPVPSVYGPSADESPFR